jgi:hypothetical protein
MCFPYLKGKGGGRARRMCPIISLEDAVSIPSQQLLSGGFGIDGQVSNGGCFKAENSFGAGFPLVGLPSFLC